MAKRCSIWLIRCTAGYAYEAACCINLFKDLFRKTIPDDVSIIVWLDIGVDYLGSIDRAYKKPQGANPDENITRFYSIQNIKKPGLLKKSEVVRLRKDEDQFHIKDAADIQRFFSEVIIKGNFAGDENFLFTWGHGASYGVFYDGNPPASVGARYPFLDAAGLRDAITGAFTSPARQRINAVIMMNCYMQFFDACFCLGQAGVEYLVASTDGADYAGYNYSRLFDHIFSAQGCSAAGLALLAISSINQRGSMQLKRVLNLRDAAIYAVKLHTVGTMGDLMNRLGAALLAEMDSGIDKIVKAQQSCTCWNTAYNLIDLFRFVEQIKLEFDNTLPGELFTELQSAYTEFFIACYLGSSMKKMLGYPLGFSVCLPNRGASPNDLQFYLTYFIPGAEFASPFANGDWARFVHRFVVG